MVGRNPESVDFGPFQFVPGDGLWRDGVPVPLPPRALGVLTTLVARSGSVVPKHDLMDAVWPGIFVTESSLLEAIGLLRDVLGDDRRRPAYIQTVHRRGYRFIGRRLEVAQPDNRHPPSSSPSFFSGPEWRPIVVASAAYVVTTIGVAVVFAVFGQHPPPPAERRASRFSIALPGDAPIDPLRGSVAVSGDGSRMVYVAIDAGRSRLYLRTIDRDEPTPIDGTDDASNPFFSPDGASIGFFSRGSLQRLRLGGSHDVPIGRSAAHGWPIPICAARAGAGATWGSDDTIVFGGGPGGGLARVSASGGGEPVVLATPVPGSRELRFGWPDVLPGNRGVIYTAMSLAGSDVALLDLRTNRRTVLAAHAAFGRYSPTGHLVFEREGRIEAARFSLTTLTTMEAPRPAVNGVSRGAMLEGPRFAFSRTGALVYVPGDTTERDPAPSWLDVSVEAGEGRTVSPTWRPDGLEIAFAFSKAGPFNLFVKPVNGQGGASPLLASTWNQFPTSWAPDARHLAFTEFQPLTGADIWMLDLRTRERRALVRTLFDETWARFSPDGRWVTYMSNESGRWEIYVRPSGIMASGPSGSGVQRFRGSEVQGSSGSGVQGPVRVSIDGGVWPCWSADGRTIYFSANDRTMAAAVRTSPELASSTPLEIPGAAALRLAGGGTAGDRLLVRQAGARPAGRAELRVVLGWFTELARPVQPS